MNDILVNDVVEIPLVWRFGVAGVINTLKGYNASAWSTNYYDIANWFREE